MTHCFLLADHCQARRLVLRRLETKPEHRHPLGVHDVLCAICQAPVSSELDCALRASWLVGALPHCDAHVDGQRFGLGCDFWPWF